MKESKLVPNWAKEKMSAIMESKKDAKFFPVVKELVDKGYNADQIKKVQKKVQKKKSDKYEAWWKENYYVAIKLAEYYGPETVAAICTKDDPEMYDETLDQMLDETLKHQAIALLYAIGPEAFDKMIADERKNGFDDNEDGF